MSPYLNAISTLNNHVSLRHYTEADIDNDTMTELLNAARRSPTSSNMQAYSLVVVRDQAKKKALAELGGAQKHIETCPVFVAICADIHRISVACQMHGKELYRNLENTLVATVDAALVGMSLATAAESIGLGTVMIGGMRNHPAEVAELLGFPQGVFVVFGLCIGHPDREEPQKPRMQHELIVHQDTYNQEQNTEQMLAEYDAALAAHYRSTGRTTPDTAWTGVIASKFSHPRRPQLRSLLEKLGFRFD